MILKFFDYFFVTISIFSFIGVYLTGIFITISIFRIKINDIYFNKEKHGKFLMKDFNPYNLSDSWRLFSKVVEENPKKIKWLKIFLMTFFLACLYLVIFDVKSRVGPNVISS